MGYLYILATVSIWAISSGVLIRSVTISPFALYSIGAFFGIAFLATVMFVQRRLSGLLKYPRTIYLLILAMGIFNALNNGIYYLAIKSGLVANAILGHYLAPLFLVVLAAPLLLKEKLTFKIAILSLVGFTGFIILTIPQVKQNLDLALYLGMISALFYAVQMVYVKKIAMQIRDQIGPIIYSQLIPCLLFAPYGAKAMYDGLTFNDWFLIFLWGVFSIGIAYIFWFKAAKLVPATHIAILSYGEPIVAIVLSIIFFNQPITFYTILGGTLIIGSGAVLAYKS